MKVILEKNLLSYVIRLKYLGGFCEDFDGKERWYRDFEVSDSITLENLNSLIQTILDWDDKHLYIFRIRNENRAFFGLDELLIVDDNIYKYLSCDISLKRLNFQESEEFYYDYDFGDEHKFSLTILNVKKRCTSNNLPTLLACQGKNIKQYPKTHLGTFIEFEQPTPEKFLHNKIRYTNYFHDYYYGSKWKIRFIQRSDYEKLQQWRRSNNKTKWDKAVVILENWNMSIEEIKNKIDQSKKQIKKWIRNFNAFGLKEIDTGRQKCDTRKLTQKTEIKIKRILEIFHQKPTSFNINRSNWNLDSIAKVYEKLYDEKNHKVTVGRMLKLAGYNIRKAKRVLTSPDPDYKEKVELLLLTLQSLKIDEELFFIDEMGPLKVKKYGGRCYVKKGEVLKITQNQISKGSITLYGALSATTNQVVWGYGKSKETLAMIDLIEVLFNKYFNTKSKIYIAWDAASWHSSNELLNWLDNFNKETELKQEGPIIEFIPLPSSSQFLNVIESVFSGMKRAVIHHSNYQSKEEMKSAISRHFLERNEYFKENPKRAGKKIWEIDFFKDYENIKSGNYRKW